ncbi:hypothetical protein PWY87_19580 [Kribbella solani]|uniref:hypothetical protein n=1 Tax=Kribbella solani TaxID=236067 RepID=UPI0029B17C7F|nr:hypothetical protein [Kribbella solani]MDX2968169.1 hypothetical protein [Kribbella solani]MDX3003900.1 hypothetical protein [Kribbella solani]
MTFVGTLLQRRELDKDDLDLMAAWETRCRELRQAILHAVRLEFGAGELVGASATIDGDSNSL